MNWVLDCSMALAWALPDERSKSADHFLSRLSKESVLWVPALWWYELSNALIVARRRKRLLEANQVRLIELYKMLPVQTDSLLNMEMVWRFYVLAGQYSLSAYDASYLELAQRKGLGLATLDEDLARAAHRAGVRLALTLQRSS